MESITLKQKPFTYRTIQSIEEFDHAKKPTVDIDVQLREWIDANDGVGEYRDQAASRIKFGYLTGAESLNLDKFEKVTKFPDLSQLVQLKAVSFAGCSALEAKPELPKNTDLVVRWPAHLDSASENLYNVDLFDDESSDENFELYPSNPTIQSSKTTADLEKQFTYEMFSEVYTKVVDNCPDIKKLLTHDPATTYKLMIAWIIRCGLTGAAWQFGLTLGALKGTPQDAGKSDLAWVLAGVCEGMAEWLCVSFILHFLSDTDKGITSDSNKAGWKQNLIEGGIWAASCIPSGTLWQPRVNDYCSAEELSATIAPICMAKVGAMTGATFGATLACIKALMTIAERCIGGKVTYFRSFTGEHTITDSLLFGQLVVGIQAAFFVLTSSKSPFNRPNYANATHFETLPVLEQMAFSAMSTALGGLAAFALRTTLLSAPVHLYENWGNVRKNLNEYIENISVNSQCTIF